MRLAGSCHCGAITFEAPVPEWLTSCNCSQCRRTSGLWAHFAPKDVTLDYDPTRAVRYVWGDRTMALISCGVCGATTHWELLDPSLERMGVNMRMCPPEDIEALRVRRFDGADTWQFLD